MTRCTYEYAPSGYLSITVWEGSTTHHYRTWEDYYADGWPPSDDDDPWDDPEPSGSGWFGWVKEWRNMTDGPTTVTAPTAPARRPRF